MIRVVYRWRVAEQDFEHFQSAWAQTTNRIHETVPGALGSFLLRSPEDRTEVLTVARWDCLRSWKAFWGAENPAEMVGLREIGERLSVTVYDEIEDHTR